MRNPKSFSILTFVMAMDNRANCPDIEAVFVRPCDNGLAFRMETLNLWRKAL
jgi:hypothetical protein